jgi:hypothetical protein
MLRQRAVTLSIWVAGLYGITGGLASCVSNDDGDGDGDGAATGSTAAGTGGSSTGDTSASSGGTTATGTGGTTSGTGGGGTGGTPEEACLTPTPTPGGPITPVESITAPERFDTNTGGWFIFHANPGDSECMTCTTTPPRDGPYTLEETDPPRGDSTMAMHWVGTDFQPGAYGGGIGIYIDNCAAVASDVTGVSFWYRSDIALLFGSNQLNVDHTIDLAPVEDWTEVIVSWDDLTPEGFDTTKIGGFFWRVVPPPMVMEDWGFDVWLDEINWVGGMAPGTGGTGGTTGAGGGATTGGGGEGGA